MMKALKRFLSLALMAMLCLGLLGVSAFADTACICIDPCTLESGINSDCPVCSAEGSSACTAYALWYDCDCLKKCTEEDHDTFCARCGMDWTRCDKTDEEVTDEAASGYDIEYLRETLYVANEYLSRTDEYPAEVLQALGELIDKAQEVYDRAVSEGVTREECRNTYTELEAAWLALFEDTYATESTDDTANDGSGMDSYSEDDDIAPLPEDDGVAMVSEDDGEDEVEAAAVTDETTTEDSDAEEESTEPLTYKEVYQAVIDQYVELVESDFDIDDYDEVNHGYLCYTLILNGQYYSDGGEHVKEGYQVYYALEDIDGNGTPELLICGSDAGVPEDGGSAIELFFSDGTEPVKLSDLYGVEFGRVGMMVLEDGTIWIGGSSGWASGETSLYTVGDDGCSIELILDSTYQYDDNGDVCTYYLNGEKVSEEEYNTYEDLYGFYGSSGTPALWDIQWHELGDWDNDTTDGTTDTTDTTGTTACTEHTWDGGQVTTAATTEAEGVMTYTCTACGATTTEAIAKLEPAEQEEQQEQQEQPQVQVSKPSSSKPTSPATGDETNDALLYVVLALVSVTGLAMVAVRARKESR